MSIGQVFSSLLGSRQTPGRTPVPPGAARSGAPLGPVLEAEIVQLSLDTDGVWHAAPAAEPAAAYTSMSSRPPLYTRRLSSTGMRLYLPTGQVQVRTPSVGLTVDLYV